MEGLLTFVNQEQPHVLRLPRSDFTVGSGPTNDLRLSHPSLPDYIGKFAWDDDASCWTLSIHSAALSLVTVNNNAIVSTTPVYLWDGVRIYFSVVDLRFNLNPDMPRLQGAPVREFSLRDEALRIGRGDDPGENRKLVLDPEDTSVSRLQAVIERRPDGWHIVNHGNEESVLNGRFFNEARLVIGDRFRSGLYHFEFTGRGIRRISASSGGRVTGRGLTRKIATGKAILNNVDIDISPGSFVGVLGRSGQGKSTLLTALCGLNPASTGQVEFDGVVQGSGARTPQIGFVPQDDIVHTELTVRKAIRYSARLRLPDSPPNEEIDRLVTEIATRLSLGEHLDKKISVLSGGQRKRVSIATELLAKPSLIYLDEPSSGLDPATEYHLMKFLRDLAGSDCTVIATTHVLGRSYLFDRILFIQDGRLIYNGNARESLQFFGEKDLDDVYLRLDTEDPSAEEWEEKQRIRAEAESYDAIIPVLHDDGAAPPGNGASFFRSFGTLLARQKSILTADKANVIFLFAQSIAIAALIGWVASNPGLRTFLAVVAVLWFGTSNAAQQIVSELAIFRRERVCGQGLNVYLLSKIFFIFAVTAAQTLVLFGVMTMVSFFVHPPPFDREILLEDERFTEAGKSIDPDDVPGTGIPRLMRIFAFSEEDAQKVAAPFVVGSARGESGEISLTDDGKEILAYDEGAIVRSVQQLVGSIRARHIPLKSDEARQIVIAAGISPKTAPPARPPTKALHPAARSLALTLVRWFGLQENVIDSASAPLQDKDGKGMIDLSTDQLKRHRAVPLHQVIAFPILLQLAAFLISALVGVAIGLAISSLVNSPTQAAMFVPLILIPQILFAGFVITLPEMSRSVRTIAAGIPSFAAQRIVDAGILYGQRIPQLTNTTKIPLFFEADYETVQWKRSKNPDGTSGEGSEETEVYEKLASSNIAIQNMIIRHNIVGQRKIESSKHPGNDPPKFTKTREDVAPYRAGMLLTSQAAARRGVGVIVVWISACYLISILALRSKSS
ncbi:MAG: ATP-binding cassette domain-containing protein [Verrucomicrobiales bacterium]|jgi:ABC-type multidrug transport system ATPase subunit|nr:ATP-binding cassette domain-containing protein [Verrucomicrobiales bacterium]